VLSNGYNNVLVLTPAFVAAGQAKVWIYSLGLPVCNLIFASAIYYFTHRFREKTIELAEKYGNVIGALAPILLGLKLILF